MQKKIVKIEAFLAKEVKKRKFNKVIFGLSGGIDSAVVAKLCKRVFQDSAKGIILPSMESNPRNTQDAIKFAQSIELSYEVINISEMEKAFIETLDLKGEKADLIRIGNFCARMRMAMLYDKSIESKSLVIGTSNKSELMLGYGTIFGDLACAINPIGSLYKTEIFSLAKVLEIPSYITDKQPSADLFAGQSDEADLGYTYKEIDSLLKSLERGAGAKELVNLGFKKSFIKSILKRIRQNKFKREMPLIAKL